MSVRYRDANPEDAPMLASFWRARYVETFVHLYRSEDLDAFLAASYSPATQFAELVDGRFAHRLAFDDDGLIGACKIGAVTLPIGSDARGSLELHRLYLVERAKGRAIADAFMHWAMAQARLQNAAWLYLGVFSENPRAIRFYRRHGFDQVGEYEFVVGAARDREFIMRAPV
jgi:ribosomal protein S18 acetylase RimI-like enzyme